MSTLNHEVYANATTPLWVSATGGGNFNSPLNIVNNLTTPTTKTSLYDTNATGGMYFTPYGSNQSQAYGEVQMDITPAVHLKTNGKDILVATPSNVTITKPIIIDNPQTSQILQIATNSIGNPANGDATIQFGSDYVNLGTTAYVGAGDGLVVYSGGFSNYAEVLPQSFTFGTSATSPLSTTETFTTATIGPLGWTSQTNIPFNGYVWSSDNPNGDAQGGLTITDPAASVKAVTNTNAPGSQKGAWLGGFLAAFGGQYQSYLEFPPITAPIGTQVSVSWKQAGSVFSINVYKNDVLFSTALNLSANRPSPTNWTTPPVMPFTFTSTGLDTFYIGVQNPTGGSYTYTPYNMSDITITIQGQVETANGGMAVSGGGVKIAQGEVTTNPTNIALGPTRIDITSGGAGTSSAAVYDGGITFNTTGRYDIVSSGMTITTGALSINAPLSMATNSMSNIGNVDALQVFSLATYTNDVYPNSGFSNVKFQAPIDLTHHDLLGCTTINNQIPGGQMNIGFLTDFVNISNGSQINTSNVDGNYATALTIGSNSALVNISSVRTIVGQGSNSSINNFSTRNYGAPFTEGFQLQYVVNWAGNKPNTMYIPTNGDASVPNQSIFGSGFTGNNFVQATGYILPPRSTLLIYNSGTLVIGYTNTTISPKLFVDTYFSPSSSTQSYTLFPYMP